MVSFPMIGQNLENVTCRIPQGVVLGPLLLNIIINDIIRKTFKFILAIYGDAPTLTSN